MRSDRMHHRHHAVECQDDPEEGARVLIGMGHHQRKTSFQYSSVLSSGYLNRRCKRMSYDRHYFLYTCTSLVERVDQTIMFSTK